MTDDTRRAKELEESYLDNVEHGLGVSTLAAALRAARDEALEEAAAVLDCWHINKGGFSEIAWKIRSLKSKGGE